MVMTRIAGAVLLIGIIGCTHANQSTVKGDYSASGKSPPRLTEAAQRDNAAAVELVKQGKLDAAEGLFKKALDEDVMFGPAHNNLGKVYFDRHQYYQAAWEFQYAQKLMPNQPEPRNNLGLVFEAAGKLSDAVASYETAIKLEPDSAEFIGNAARARVRRGDRSPQVRELLQKLIERDTRPEWVEWARQTLRTTSWSATTSPATEG